MARTVAVAGGTPIWRRGIAATVADQDLTSVEYEQLVEWKPGRGGSAVVAWAGDNAQLAGIQAFVQDYPAIPVVAVVPRLDAGSLAAALRAGATCVLDEADPTEAFGRAFDAATQNCTLLPRHLALAMATRVPTTPDPESWVSPDEAAWLRDLAAGLTVAALAAKIGYSERETFRMLGELYQKIGVRNRTESIIWATRHGLLDG